MVLLVDLPLHDLGGNLHGNAGNLVLDLIAGLFPLLGNVGFRLVLQAAGLLLGLVDDFVAALMDLKLGGIDVLLIDSVVGNYYIAQQDDPTLFTVLPEVMDAEEYGIAFRKGEDTLADAVSETLIAMAEDGTLDAIRANWFANDITLVSKYAADYKK